MPKEKGHYTLYVDLTRLIEHATRHMPAGIDRTEYEYATFLLRQSAIEVTYVFCHPLRGIGFLKKNWVRQLLDFLSQLWNTQRPVLQKLRLFIAKLYVTESFSSSFIQPRGSELSSKSYYLILSHHHLDRPRVIERFLQATGSQLVVMVHDLIPILYPEYSGPRECARHKKRLETLRRFKSFVITPSRAVQKDLTTFLPKEAKIKAIMHGITPIVRRADNDDPTAKQLIPRAPYFIYISTIEPRKNHLLLLNIWRRMAKTIPHANMPHLVLVGRRGWENENIIDMLDRCPVNKHFVHEYNHLNDEYVGLLLQHSHGLVFPSFAEGFGLPLAEALLEDKPAICSDLPVFHEIAQDGAYFLDPLDGPAWMKAIGKLSAFTTPQTRTKLFPSSPAPPLHSWPHQIQKTLDWLEEESRY